MKLVKFFAIAVAAFAVACAPEENKTNAPQFELTESKIYIDVTAGNWEKVLVHAWNDNGDLTGGWPGVEVTEKAEKDGKEYFVWVAAQELCGQSIGFILNNGLADPDLQQTVDITLQVVDGTVVALTQLEKEDNTKYWLYSINGEESEAPAPTPEPVVVLGDHSWGIIGSFAASDDPETEDVGWEKDVTMTIVDGWAVATVELEANAEFKIRSNGSWDDPNPNYGFNATEEMTTFPVDGTQFAASYKGGNLKVAEAGTYEVSFTIDGENEYFKVLKK